jgi:hypothetical protein
MKKWSESEINLIKENATKGITYKETALILGRSAKSTQLKMNRLGYEFSDFYQKETPYCKNCGEEILNRGIDFCSQSCSAKFWNPKKRSKRKNLKCQCCDKSLHGRQGRKFCSIECNKKYKNDSWIKAWKSGEKLGFSGEAFTIAPAIRRYLFDKYDHKCCKCGWNEVNLTTNKIPLQVNHLDGNPSNNKEENLELICPNCHSLTSNFMALNKNSCRTNRRRNGGSPRTRTETD